MGVRAGGGDKPVKGEWVRPGLFGGCGNCSPTESDRRWCRRRAPGGRAAACGGRRNRTSRHVARLPQDLRKPRLRRLAELTFDNTSRVTGAVGPNTLDDRRGFVPAGRGLRSLLEHEGLTRSRLCWADFPSRKPTLSATSVHDPQQTSERQRRTIARRVWLGGALKRESPQLLGRGTSFKKAKPRSSETRATGTQSVT